MKKLIWMAIVGYLLVGLGADLKAQPPRRVDPGLNGRTPVVTAVKWETLTAIQQEALVKAWGLTPAAAAAKWATLSAAEQHDALVKYAKLKVVSPRR